MESISRKMAQFALSLSYDAIPMPARREAKRFLLDSIGCALAALDLEDMQAAYRYIENLGGHEQASIIGPFLLVDAPEDGATVEHGSCVVSGRTEPGVKVLVNESPAAVSEEGEFSSTVELTEGQYLVWVVARGPEGAETTVVREVVQAAAAGAFGLKASQQHGCLRQWQPPLEVMQNPTAVHHATGGNDYPRAIMGVDRL